MRRRQSDPPGLGLVLNGKSHATHAELQRAVDAWGERRRRLLQLVLVDQEAQS
jgi:hypothetical protein